MGLGVGLKPDDLSLFDLIISAGTELRDKERETAILDFEIKHWVIVDRELVTYG